jgi:ribose-phosphate pyrophosphokinase
MNHLFLEDIESWKFPGGEIGVRLSDTDLKLAQSTKIYARLRNSDDIIKLMMVVDAIRRRSLFDITAYIPYVPYARQDRVCNPGEALSIKVMSDIINSLEFKKISVFDPHSNVTTALLKRCEAIPNYVLVAHATNKLRLKNLKFVSPDEGAEKKIFHLGKFISNFQVARAGKKRNLATGEIIETVLYDDVSGYDCLVCDDLCDGGRTFIELAKKLKDGGAKDLYLVVSHGIFSAGLDELLKYYTKIFTTNSFYSENEYKSGYEHFMDTGQLNIYNIFTEEY